MSPERDDPTDEHEQELYEDVPPRSIFAATWFRVVLVVIVLGVVGAVAGPYVLDWMNPPPPRSAGTTKSPMGPSTSTTPSVIDRQPADKAPGEKSTSEKSGGDKPATDKRDSTLYPAPGAPTPSTPPARLEPRPSAAPPAKPAPEPKTAAKAAPESKPAPETKAAPTPPAETKSKGAMAVTEGPTKPSTAPPKSETGPATATNPSAQRQAAAKATTPTPAAVGGGAYWVQVGAFKDPETAKRVATKLREENFKVEESRKRVGGSAPAAAPSAAKAPAVASPSDQYDVFVTGMSVEDLNRRLAGKGLSAETSGSGVIVKPSLPLRDAVALSKDLAVEGFKVQVRRAGGSTPAASSPTAPNAPTEGGQALHRVRVGSFSDKAAALAAARELEAKGYKPYIARGDQ